jgi:hypothetical protein
MNDRFAAYPRQVLSGLVAILDKSAALACTKLASCRLRLDKYVAVDRRSDDEAILAAKQRDGFLAGD